jgi:small subunit ribosomal protein S9
MAATQYYGTGRRKTATARVFLRQGRGAISINDRPLDQYFGRQVARMIVRQPLELIEGWAEKFDVSCHGQRRRQLRPGGRDPSWHHARPGRIRRDAEVSRCASRVIVTRDAREVERKKVGLRKARKRPQYSKR